MNRRIAANLILAVFIATASFGVTALAQLRPDLMAITVRAGIDDAEKAKRDRDPAYAQESSRAHVFVLASVKEEKSRFELIKPVDARAIAVALTHELEAHGFHAAGPGQKPDVVLTVKYGRGILPNPYSDRDADKQHTNLSNSDSLEIWPTHDSYVGLEEKRQRARHEKLIIQVRAWKYPPPTDPKEKEKLLWMTTVYVSDPNHNDLNEFAPRMLANAAPYFDQHIAREHEIVVVVQKHEHVTVGTPQVTDAAPAKTP
jgi:hypothetical protein